MSITCEQIRSHVREYFDVDAEEVTDGLIDRWTSEGWVRIARKTRVWPTFEAIATLGVTTGEQSYQKPLRIVTSLYEEVTDGLLSRLDRQTADRLYPPPISTGRPNHWAEFANELRIYPIPDADYNFRVLGARAPVSPMDKGPTEVIDLPADDAADSLVQWVMHRAAYHQAEPEMALSYRSEFDASLKALALDELHAPTGRPIVLNSRKQGGFLPDRLRYGFESGDVTDY